MNDQIQRAPIAVNVQKHRLAVTGQRLFKGL